ncbi:MAG: hypothetical protein WA771_12500 [Chthoniobacterales bacterium]
MTNLFSLIRSYFSTLPEGLRRAECGYAAFVVSYLCYLALDRLGDPVNDSLGLFLGTIWAAMMILYWAIVLHYWKALRAGHRVAISAKYAVYAGATILGHNWLINAVEKIY